METEVIPSTDLDSDIDRYLLQGFRLEMITPSDAPREVLLTDVSQRVLLRSTNRKDSGNADWITGRAGMMYRDLIPDRLGGKLIASHICITEGGPVPDYVHYHKVRFQTIYCLRGRIRVVYEDQGEPFWLEPGDCVLQPPEIRHRVLEAEANSEVLEISSPAEHETWVEHTIKLPTNKIDANRDFNGQRFARYSFVHHDWKLHDSFPDERDSGICRATGGAVDVRRYRMAAGKKEDFGILMGNNTAAIYFLISGRLEIEFMNGQIVPIEEENCAVISSKEYFRPRALSDAEFIRTAFVFS